MTAAILCHTVSVSLGGWCASSCKLIDWGEPSAPTGEGKNAYQALAPGPWFLRWCVFILVRIPKGNISI